MFKVLSELTIVATIILTLAAIGYLTSQWPKFSPLGFTFERTGQE